MLCLYNGKSKWISCDIQDIRLVLFGGYYHDLEPYHDFVVEIVYFLSK